MTKLPIYPRTRELMALRERLGRTEKVQRVTRDTSGDLVEVRERAEPIADPAAVAELRVLGVRIARDLATMRPNERIQVADALARTLRVAEAQLESGSFTAAHGILADLLRDEGIE